MKDLKALCFQQFFYKPPHCRGLSLQKIKILELCLKAPKEALIFFFSTWKGTS